MREVIEVEIGYRDPRHDIRNDIGLLRDACASAGYNLKFRHHITLEGPYLKDEKVYVRLSGKMDDDFSTGNHLRGISSYLIKNCSWIRKTGYKAGDGLLHFHDTQAEFQNVDSVEKEIRMTINEKHELILSFNSSEELWQFAKKHQDKIVGVVDYKLNTLKENEE